MVISEDSRTSKTSRTIKNLIFTGELVGKILNNRENIGKTIGSPATKSSLSRIFSTVVLSTFRLIANGFKSVKLLPTVCRGQ